MKLLNAVFQLVQCFAYRKMEMEEVYCQEEGECWAKAICLGELGCTDEEGYLEEFVADGNRSVRIYHQSNKAHPSNRDQSSSLAGQRPEVCPVFLASFPQTYAYSL